MGIVFVGIILAALGGFGTFHFGHQVAREEEQQRTVAVQSLTEVVSTLRDEQGGLVARVTTVEDKVAEAPPPMVAKVPSINPPPAMTVPSVSLTPPTTPAPFTLSATPPEAAPGQLQPKLPPVASGPGPTDEEETDLPAIKPPKLPPPPATSTPPDESSLPPAPSVAVREDEGPLTYQKRARLVKRLRNHPQHAIVIRAAADNPQAVKLAITLKSVFREAGWNVSEIEMVSKPLPPHTLLLSTGVFPPPKEFVAAYAALAGTGFLVTSDLDPNQNRQRVVVSVGPIR